LAEWQWIARHCLVPDMRWSADTRWRQRRGETSARCRRPSQPSVSSTSSCWASTPRAMTRIARTGPGWDHGGHDAVPPAVHCRSRCTKPRSISSVSGRRCTAAAGEARCRNRPAQRARRPLFAACIARRDGDGFGWRRTARVSFSSSSDTARRQPVVARSRPAVAAQVRRAAAEWPVQIQR